MLGERLHALVDTEAAKAAAGAVLLSPFTPMLWMGEEYAEPAPFQFFVSHTDPELIEAVREGRASEFEYFSEWREARTPDPQSEETFRRSTLDRSLRAQEPHARVERCYAALLRARRQVAALADPDATEPLPRLHGPALAWTRTGPDGGRALVVVNPSAEPVRVPLDGEHAGAWAVELDTADEPYGGPGATAPPAGDHVLVGPHRTVLLLEEHDDSTQERQ